MTREEIVNSMSLQDAIQVLKDTNCYGTMDIAKTVILKALEQEPCDAVSRKEVMNMLHNHAFDYATSTKILALLKTMCGEVDRMPSVIPQYTEAEIQKMQELEQAEIQKAYEIGKEEGSSEKPNKWIPVSEGLPEVMDGTNGECSDDVLICVEYDEQITISTGFYGYYPNSKSQQGWWSVWAYGCHQLDSKYKVVAWTPLSEPYKASPTGAESEE